jgi:putative NADPH-quinone reductase
MINPGNKEGRTGVSGRDLAIPVAANRKERRKRVLKVSVILAHPRRGSFNHAIAETVVAELCRNGHSVSFHDLHREGFDPVLTGAELSSKAVLPPLVAVHCEEIAAADGIVIVHPNWWGQPPAVLTGWVDRVLRPGVAYRFLEGDNGEGIPRGLLKARVAIVFNTSNTAPAREEEVFGDPLDAIWKKCVFDLCGVKKVHRTVFSVVVTSRKEQRSEWLSEVRATVGRHFPAGAASHRS